jgi:hypothetical protein
MVTMMLAVASWAGPALDYVAFEGCPDAGRFSDEVSARIGAQAFDTEQDTMVVRLVEVSGEVVGTLEYGEGSRMARGATCPEAFGELVVAAATLLGAPPQASSPEMVRVTMESTKPGVTVARITGHGTAVGTGGTAMATFYEDICIAPCTFELPRGMHELGTYGHGTRGIMRKFQLEEPEVHLQSQPSSALSAVGGYALLTLGLGAAVTGGTLLAVMDCSDGLPSSQRSCQSTRGVSAGMLVGGLVSAGVGGVFSFKTGKIVEKGE